MFISLLSHLYQRVWQDVPPASQPQPPSNRTSPGPPHPAPSPLWWRETGQADPRGYKRLADVTVVAPVGHGGGGGGRTGRCMLWMMDTGVF